MVESKKRSKDRTFLGEDGLPTRIGVYLARGVWGDETENEIDVYRHPIKGLSCFTEDFGSGGAGVDDRYDCHVSVQFTGLEFIRRIRSIRPRRQHV